MTARRPCCATWDDNQVIAETPLMRAVHDGHPVVPGHALIYPTRHVDRLEELRTVELIDLRELVSVVQQRSDADDFTIAVNDGELAGRTVPHLHVHVIPRRAGDVADPRGGVRRLLVPDVADDTWITSGTPEPVELDATTLGDLRRGVRVFIGHDGVRREEPLEG